MNVFKSLYRIPVPCIRNGKSILTSNHAVSINNPVGGKIPCIHSVNELMTAISCYPFLRNSDVIGLSVAYRDGRFNG